MVDEIVTRQELIDAKRDARDLGKAVNEKVIVSPRHGEDFKSLPMIADEGQAVIDNFESTAQDKFNEWDSAINLITQDAGVPALAVSTANNENQQSINDSVGAKWYAKGGGYPINYRVMLDNGDIVKSTVDGNTNDPNVDMTGWVKVNEASQIFDASGKNQQEINDNLYTSINVFTKRSTGFISLFEFIPQQFHEDLKTLQTSGNNVGDVSMYVQAALDYAALNHLDVLAPFGYHFVAKPINIPANIRFIGLSLPYFLTTFNFVGDTVFNIDHALQEQYHVENFRFSGNDDKDYSAIHVGGCRNSVFKNIVGTSFKGGVIRVYPTHANSGDVENIELDHIWAVRSAGLVFKTNSDISRGNITDGTITNCQLTSGDAENVDGYALELTASTGKLIFGLKFDRIFTKTTDNNHIIINPNGGAIYGNAFKNFTGESWSIVNSLDYITEHCLYVFDGAFFSNKFESFYKTGMQGNGIRLGAGSIANVFDDLMFQDHVPLYNFKNTFVNFANGAKDNVFTNIYIRDAIDGGNTSAASTLFGSSLGRFVGDSVRDNQVTGQQLTNVAPVLLKKSYIFETNGLQLKNYPVEGCTFTAHPEGVVMTIPANATEYVLNLPFVPTRSVSRVSALFHYVFDSERNGINISVDLCGSVVNSAGYDRYVDKYVAFIANYNSNSSRLRISFGGSRTAEVRILIKDIVICQGGVLPYAPNYQKNYIEI